MTTNCLYKVCSTLILLDILSNLCPLCDANITNITTTARPVTKLNDTTFTTGDSEEYINVSPLRINYTIIRPAVEKHSSTIIFLHGLCGSGEQWANAICHARQPFMKVICPVANTMPITMWSETEETAWYNMNDSTINYNQDKLGIRKAIAFVHNLIEEEIERGTPSERIMIGGFDQGGAIALQSAFSFPKRLGGLVAIAAWIPLIKQFYAENSDANVNLNTLLVHGKLDQTIPYGVSDCTAIILRNFTNNLHFAKFPDGNHVMGMEEMDAVKDYIKKHMKPI